MGRYHSEGTLFRVRPSGGLPYVPLTLIVSLFMCGQSSVKADVMLVDVKLVRYSEYDDREDLITITCAVSEVHLVVGELMNDPRFHERYAEIEITKHGS